MAGVVIEIKPGDLFGSSSRPVAASVTSDAQGRFRAVGLAPGQYTLFAVRSGTPYIASSIPTVDVAAGADTSAPDIYMTRSMSLNAPAQEAYLSGPITFSWEQVQGATRYELYVIEVGSACAAPGFGPAPQPITTAGTSLVRTLAAGKHYFWTVKARVDGGDVAYYNGAARCIWVQ